MILKHIYLYPDLVEFADRKDDLAVVRDQTRHVCNYLERQLAALKFQVSGFNRICVIGYTNPATAEMYVNTSHALSVPIEFDMDKCRATPPHLLGDYFANQLAIGLRRCASEYLIPLNEMLGWLADLKAKGYRNEWTFKEKSFRQFGIACRLECSMSLDEFSLRFRVERKGSMLFDQVILTTPPDEIAFQHRFKDIVVEGGYLAVTTKLHGEDHRILYKIALSTIA